MLQLANTLQSLLNADCMHASIGQTINEDHAHHAFLNSSLTAVALSCIAGSMAFKHLVLIKCVLGGPQEKATGIRVLKEVEELAVSKVEASQQSASSASCQAAKQFLHEAPYDQVGSLFQCLPHELVGLTRSETLEQTAWSNGDPARCKVYSYCN